MELSILGEGLTDSKWPVAAQRVMREIDPKGDIAASICSSSNLSI
jgi:hypothetical protein